jgi:catechol 2,3-dioxygenase-like lactoylglutathione lyase family enzyme
MTSPDVHPLLDLVILDCPDPQELGRFYSELLGWPVQEGADESWVTLVPPGGRVSRDNPAGRATVAFQRIEDYVAPTWPGGRHPQQFHLDLLVDDIDAAEPGVLELGATRHAHQPATDGGFRVFLDPARHPFCLIR